MDQLGEDGPWGIVVPPVNTLAADWLWQAWLSSTGIAVSDGDVKIETCGSSDSELRSYSVRGVSTDSIYTIADAIRADCKVGDAIISEHLVEWHPEILAHLLVADLRRHVEQLGAVTDCACIGHLDHGLRVGDAAVQNAVAVSFVEDWSWWEFPVEAFDDWPDALRAEVLRHVARVPEAVSRQHWPGPRFLQKWLARRSP